MDNQIIITDVPYIPLPSSQGIDPAKFLNNVSEIQIGVGAKSFKADKSGIWLGANTFATAPFKVDINGNVTASSLTASGYIAVGGAAADVNAGVTTISGGKLTTGTVTADYVVASISITSPTITGGTIAIGTGNSIFKADSNGIYLGNSTFASAPFRVNMTGDVTMKSWTLQSPDGGTSIVGVNTGVGGGGILFPNNTGVIFKDVGGTLRSQVYMDTSDKLRIQNTTGQTSLYGGNYEGVRVNTDGSILVSYGGTLTGTINISNDLNMVGGSITATGSTIYIASGKSLVFSGTQGSINCGSIDCDAITTNGSQITCGRVVSSNYQPQFNSHTITINSSATLDKNFISRFVSGRGCGIKMDDSGTDYTFEIQGSSGNGFWINGNWKTAIVPTKKDGYRALYCVEAPEVWFMDFTKEDKVLDPMFDEVTTGECKWIKTEGGYQVWRRRRGAGQVRFERKTEKEFLANEKYLRMARPNN